MYLTLHEMEDLEWVEKSFNIVYNIRQPHKEDCSQEFNVLLDILFSVDGVNRIVFKDYNNWENLIQLRMWMENLISGVGDVFTFTQEGNAETVTLQCHQERSATVDCSYYLVELVSGRKKYRFKCEQRQFIKVLYFSLINMSASIVFCGNDKLFCERWNRTLLELYNHYKSYIVEKFLYGEELYLDKDDYERCQIREVISLWTEWGQACFWHSGGGCSELDYIVLYNGEKISLESIVGLKEWDDIFEASLSGWEIPFYKWFEQGISLAKKIREILPPEVDLIYDGNGCGVPRKYAKRCHVQFDGEKSIITMFHCLKTVYLNKRKTNNKTMIGAIAGDIIGSIYEFNNIKTKDFPLFSAKSSYTDDSILSIAVADWLLHGGDLVKMLQDYGNKYPCPMGGYGGRFGRWLVDKNPQPYNSWGNGSAMRVSAVGWFFDSLEETLKVARETAIVTHNHPEGIKGAQAVAAAIFLARTRKDKCQIKEYVEQNFGYDLNRSCDEIRPVYLFDESCQRTVPEAIIAFLESENFEDAIRLAVSLGGDSDTLGCITGGIAEAFYGVPMDIKEKVRKLLDADLWKIVKVFTDKKIFILDGVIILL